MDVEIMHNLQDQVQRLVERLDLEDYLDKISQNLARIRPTKSLSALLREENQDKAQRLIKFFLGLSKDLALPKLPPMPLLDQELAWLDKGASLSLHEVIAIARLIKLFEDLQPNPESKIQNEEANFFADYARRLRPPLELRELIDHFALDEEGLEDSMFIKRGVCKELDSLRDKAAAKHKEREASLYEILRRPSLQEFLADSRIHLRDGAPTLLLKAGFSKVLAGRALARSSSGLFYVLPLAVERLQDEINRLKDEIWVILNRLTKEYSRIYRSHIAVLRVLDLEFDSLDRVMARLRFARDFDLEFVFCSLGDAIVIKDYSHPSLKRPKPLSLEFSKGLMLITGVNAGGKTMLLKSLLSCLFCSKHMLPLQIDSNKSRLPFVENLVLISQDPQEAKEDISTFSGRIKEISQILNKDNLLVGIDEIERGTDASEAASLYKVILEFLLERGARVAATTHHKHLVSMLASHPQTQLLATLYDPLIGKPTYDFIEGIGKSYALECALLYGIPSDLIARARHLAGQATRLDTLIDEAITQINANRQKEKRLENLQIEYKNKLEEIETTRRELRIEFDKKGLELKRHYNEALKEVKMLARKADLEGDSKKEDSKKEALVKNIHRLLNKAHKKQNEEPKMQVDSMEEYEVGQRVSYNGQGAKILSMDSGKPGKTTYTIELDRGMKLRGVKAARLSKACGAEKKVHSSYKLEVQPRGSLKLDLHGCTAEEALDRMEDFLSQALVSRLSEVVIVHGIGGGKLKRVVVDYLKRADFVRGFNEAPANLGGAGARVVYLH